MERYNRTYEGEAIRVYLPTTFLETQDMNHDQIYYYNHKRPNQAKSCGNLPPCVAFPNLPPLPALPQQVDPNRWLDSLNGQLFKRRVDATGTIHLDKHRYYVGRNRHKQTVLLQIDAPQRQVNALVDGQVIKTFPLKGLDPWDRFEMPLPFARIAILAGAPLRVPPQVRGPALETLRLELEARLNRLFELSQSYF